MQKVVQFSLVFVMALAIVSFSIGKGSAQEAPLTWACYMDEGQMLEDVPPLCDVQIMKEVSVNGGAFVAADTAETAAQAQIGSSVTWRITVTDVSTGGYQIDYELLIDDILPVSVTYVSHVASAGSYDQSQWQLPVSYWNEQEQILPALPATLVIQSTAAQVGSWENTAVITSADCDGWCDYTDANIQNNRNSAFVNVAAATVPTTPQVLGAATTPAATIQAPQVLAATGSLSPMLKIAIGSGVVGAVIILRRAVHITSRK